MADDNLQKYEQMSRAELISELRGIEIQSTGEKQLQSARHDLEIYQEEMRAQTRELIEIQKSLEESRDRYADLYDFAPLTYLTFDANGLIEEINLTGTTLLGIERSRLLGRPFIGFVSKSDQPIFLQHMRRCRNEPGPISTDLKLDVQGGIIPVQLFSKSAPSAEGRGPFYRTAITDLTERKKAEETLRESREWLKLAQTAAGAGAWDWNLDTRELKWSDGLYEVFGLEPGAVKPTLQNWLALVHPEDRDRVRQIGFCRDSDNTVQLEFRIRLPNGQVRWLNSKGKLLPDGEGTRVIGITMDVTDLKKAEQRQRELNEALHQRTVEAELRALQLRAMASDLTQAEQRERRRLAQILHDHLQQLLIAAKMHIGNLCDDAPNDEHRQAISYVEQMLNDCLDASRSLTLELSPPILHDRGLVAALHWLARWMKEKHDLTVETDADEKGEPQAESIRILLFEIVRELLLNVVKHAQVDRAVVQLKTVADNELQILVEDDGIGFDLQEAQSRSDSSLGFGLSSVQHRLEMLGGHMELHSSLRRGTRILLRAPLRDPQQQGTTAARRPRPPRIMESTPTPLTAERQPEAETDGSEKIRVLLADDHKIVREGLAGLLERCHDIEVVGEAEDGQAAVDLARELQPDVVIMDVNLPRLNGLAATQCISSEMPDIRVIGLSLHDEEDMAHAMFDAGAIAYLAKGGPSHDLLAAIRSAGRTEPRDKQQPQLNIASRRFSH